MQAAILSRKQLLSAEHQAQNQRREAAQKFIDDHGPKHLGELVRFSDTFLSLASELCTVAERLGNNPPLQAKDAGNELQQFSCIASLDVGGTATEYEADMNVTWCTKGTGERGAQAISLVRELKEASKYFSASFCHAFDRSAYNDNGLRGSGNKIHEVSDLAAVVQMFARFFEEYFIYLEELQSADEPLKDNLVTGIKLIGDITKCLQEKTDLKALCKMQDDLIAKTAEVAQLNASIADLAARQSNRSRGETRLQERLAAAGAPRSVS